MTEGIDLYRLPTRWSNGEAVLFLPVPEGPNYEISGEMLELLLRRAGYSPKVIQS